MGGGLQCESFFWLVGSDVTGWCSGNHWIGALVSVEELKDIVICIPWGRTRILAYHCIVAFLLFPCFCVCAQSLNSVWLFVTPWTVAHQPPPSMGFSRQEYWSGFPFSYSRGSSWPKDWMQEFNLLHLLHCQADPLPLVPQVKPFVSVFVCYQTKLGFPSPIFWHWVVVRESAGAYWKASDKEHGQLMLKKPELPGGRRAGSQGEWSYESQENFKRAEIMRNATYPQIMKKMCPLNVASWMWLLVEFHPY